jgi:MFS superfamily sulfate permease-like transporter
MDGPQPDSYARDSMNPVPSSRDALLADVVAGLSIAGLLLPEAVAYSAIGGLPPQAGVIALFAGLVAYGLFGTSRFAIVSATSSSAAVLLAATASIAPANGSQRLAVAAAIILATGALFVVASLARLGNVSSFIAKPVLRGFAFGLALTITVRQLPKIAGIDVPHGNVFVTVGDLAAAWRAWNPGTLAIGIGALTGLGVLARWPRIPAALLVIAAGIAVGASGFAVAHHVPVVGTIALALDMPTLPDLAAREWARAGELAAAMTLILYAESYGSIRNFAMLHGDPMRPDRDLLALGAANLLSGLFHGMPVGAGFSATSANEAAGARSRAAGGVAAVAVLVLVVALLPWIARTPEPVLAAIVIHAVGRNIDPSALRQYFAWRRDRRIAVAAVVAVLVLGVLDGLLLAIGASLALMLRELSKSRVAWLGRLGGGHDYIDLDRHAEARPVPGVLIARPDTPVFFANAERIFATVRARAESEPALRAVIVSLEDSPDLDSTSIEALREFTQVMHLRGTRVILARVKDHVRDMLLRVQVSELPPDCYAPWSVADAVRLAESVDSAPASA